MSWFKKKKPRLYPSHMVVGLGNPGGEYKGTRHNIGFEAVDLFAKRHKNQLSKAQHRAMIAIFRAGDGVVLVAKPLTFMNLSGQSVGALANQFGIPPESILVITDDLDMEVGRVRMRAQGSSGGHNGHKSLAQALKTQAYPRIKIGIGNANAARDHVLSRFHPDERPEINAALGKCVAGIEAWLSNGIEAAMNQTNRKDDSDE